MSEPLSKDEITLTLTLSREYAGEGTGAVLATINRYASFAQAKQVNPRQSPTVVVQFGVADFRSAAPNCTTTPLLHGLVLRTYPL